jgi:hypothetical protein
MSNQYRLLTATVIKVLILISHIIRHTRYYSTLVLVRNTGQTREGDYFQ